MSDTTIAQRVTLDTESRPDTSVGLGPDAVSYAPKISAKVTEWADEAKQEYVKDVVLKVDGIPVDPLVGAMAIHRAYVRRFGVAPRGVEIGPYPAMEKLFHIQEYKYMLKDGTFVTDTELDQQLVWTVTRIVAYLEEYHPEIELPRYIANEQRNDLLGKMKGTLKPSFAPTKQVSLRWGGIKYPTPDHPERTGDITLCAWEADGRDYGAPGQQVSQVYIFATKQHAAEVDEFLDLILEEVPKVYENKFLVIGRNSEVTFLDPWSRGANRNEIVHPEETQKAIELRVWNPLIYADQACAMGIFNRKVLITGPVGTAKTMTILLSAQVALENGCTVILIQPGNEGKRQFSEAMRYASMFKRVIIIIEDLEKMMPDTENMSIQQRLTARSELLDLFDGSAIKGKPVQFWLTTNYPDLFISGMARPGRTDVYLEFKTLDRSSFEKLTRIKLAGHLADDIDFDKVWESVGAMTSSFLAKIGEYARDCQLGKPADYQITMDELDTIIANMSGHDVWFNSLVDNENRAQKKTAEQVVRDLIAPIVADELEKYHG